MEHSNTIDLCVKTSKLLPTKKIPEFLNNIVRDFITQEGKKELHKIIASPLCINTSDSIGSFITSEFNHDGDSYRSPWSNEYFPTTEGHKLLPNELRELEVRLNKLVKLYTKLYYGEQAISSTYIWEQGDAISSGFNCAVLIKNNIDTVIVCESQINALTLWSWGYPAIALIGTGSPHQYEVLKKSGIRNYILCFDGDEAGDKGTNRFKKNMSSDVFISTKLIPRGKDVNNLTKEEFDKLPLI